MNDRAQKSDRSARGPRPHTPRSLGSRIRAYFLNHGQTFRSSLERLVTQPVSSLMTTGVIGIAFALPAALYVVVQNGKLISGGWENVADMSIYLRRTVSTSDAENLAASLRERSEFSRVEVIPADAALDEFRQHSGFGPALDALTQNPLPTVLVVRPAPEHASPRAIESLSESLQELGEVELVQVDTQWVGRFNAILDMIRRIVYLAALLFATGVLIIVWNTIRLDIQNRRREIEVTKLVGGSDRFIRRPFLYTGLWYGIGGALLALAAIELALAALQGPAARLAGLYGADYRLRGLDLRAVLALVGSGALLGWLGAWLSTTRHIREIEPG